MPNPDQNDVIAANERLTSELATATRERDEARASIATLTTERDAARSSVATITGERDSARADLAKVTAERDGLAKVDRDFNTRVAAEVAKHGIRVGAIKGIDEPSKAAGAKTATQKVLEAKGVTSLEELAKLAAK